MLSFWREVFLDGFIGTEDSKNYGEREQREIETERETEKETEREKGRERVREGLFHGSRVIGQLIAGTLSPSLSSDSSPSPSSPPHVEGLNALSLPILSHLCELVCHLITHGPECLDMLMYLHFIEALEHFVTHSPSSKKNTGDTGERGERGGEMVNEERGVRRQLLTHIAMLRQVWTNELALRQEKSLHILLQDTSIESNDLLPKMSILTLNTASSLVSMMEDLQEIRQKVHDILTLKQSCYHIHMPDKKMSEVSF
jgi:hypothetical protein